MDSALEFLRNWLPVGQHDGAQSLRDWVDHVRGAPAEEVLSSLAKRLTTITEMPGNLHMHVKLLDAFDGIAQEMLPPLEQKIETADLPFDTKNQARAIAADNLLKGLATAYGNVATNIEKRKLAEGLAPLVQHTLQRAITSLRRRQLLAYRAHAMPSAASWQQLHEAYRTAARLDLLGPAKSGPEIGHLYVSTLLIAYADPGKFARTEFDTLLDCAVRAAALVRLFRDDSLRELRLGTPLFAVAPDETGPGKTLVWLGSADGKECLYLDCTELVATIRNDSGVKAKLDKPHEWLLPNASLAMLRKLSAMWAVQPTRRYSRTRFKPRADLVIGLADVSLLLSSAAATRSHGGPAVSEWMLIDESPDGFGIRYVRGEIAGVEVGDVVALRPRESDLVQICIVRRINNAGRGRFELGLQDLSPHALVVELPTPPDHTPHRAVLLPKMPAYGNAAGLLAGPGTVPRELELRYRVGDGMQQLRLAQRIEGNDNSEFHLLQAIPGAH